MTAYNFKEQFANDVEAGRKTQTIRAARKDGRVPRAGDLLQLYTGMRTKQCRKLGDAVCDYVREVTMTELGIKLDGQAIYPQEILRIARNDGFQTVEEFRAFFRDNYGFPFKGYLIKWM